MIAELTADRKVPQEVEGRLLQSVEHWRYLAPLLQQLSEPATTNKIISLLNAKPTDLAHRAQTIGCEPINLANTKLVVPFLHVFALKCVVFGAGIRESGSEPFLDLLKTSGIGVAANSLSRRCVMRGPNLYGKALDDVRTLLTKAPTDIASSIAYHPSTEPSVYLFGDETAFSLSIQFMRSPQGIQHMWMPGEPSCQQLLDLMHRTDLKQSSSYVCIMISRYELTMSASTRNELYSKMLQSLNGDMKMPILIVAPLPYPGLEMPAVRAAAFLRSECGSGHVRLLEPTEQFLIGKHTRPSLYTDRRSLSAEGTRLLAVFLRDRSEMNLPPLMPDA